MMRKMTMGLHRTKSGRRCHCISRSLVEPLVLFCTSGNLLDTILHNL
jgi:hypothetical protein